MTAKEQRRRNKQRASDLWNSAAQVRNLVPRAIDDESMTRIAGFCDGLKAALSEEEQVNINVPVPPTWRAHGKAWLAGRLDGVLQGMQE